MLLPLCVSACMLTIHEVWYNYMEIVVWCALVFNGQCDFSAVPTFRFSRRSLSDVSVSVVSITTSVDGISYAIEFAASSSALPIAQGLANNPLPTGCTASSIEFNTYTGWVVQRFNGFSLAERDSSVYLEVSCIYTEYS